MGHALLMGPLMGVPGTCFNSEFALGFRRVHLCHLHPRSTQEQCCFCLWAWAGSGQAHLCVAGTPERVQLTLSELCHGV